MTAHPRVWLYSSFPPVIIEFFLTTVAKCFLMVGVDGVEECCLDPFYEKCPETLDGIDFLSSAQFSLSDVILTSAFNKKFNHEEVGLLQEFDILKYIFWHKIKTPSIYRFVPILVIK